MRPPTGRAVPGLVVIPALGFMHVPASKHAGSAWNTQRICTVGIRKSCTGGGYRIDVWRFDCLMASTAHGIGSVFVGHDDKHIRHSTGTPRVALNRYDGTEFGGAQRRLLTDRYAGLTGDSTSRYRELGRHRRRQRDSLDELGLVGPSMDN